MHADTLLILFVQVGLILVLSRIMGSLVNRIGQPHVIGEIIAGIMLGPSLLGLVAPELFRGIFPTDSIHYLELLSQLGVIFFLFLVGLDFDPELVRRRGASALIISTSSVAVPFFVGVGLAFYLYPRLFDDPQRERFVASALFMGAAISVTAFPVLARILTERNLHKTQVGTLSIAGAALNDVIAWCMLAVVVAVTHFDPAAGPRAAMTTIAMVAGYIAFMLLVLRPFLRRIQIYYDRQGRLVPQITAIIFLLILASAYTTERIGIHALFGAFLLGCVMPKGLRFVRELRDKLEDFTMVFLLPVFFAFAGLSTDFTRIFEHNLWGYAGIVIVAACLGKIGGTAIAARVCGQPWRESTAVGVLMNTRGLMELIILTIGLSLGVINEEVFAILVLMALVTTAMTGPLLQLIYPPRTVETEAAETVPRRPAYSVLIPVSDPTSGAPLLRLASAIAGPDPEESHLLALHLRQPSDRDAFRAGLDVEQERDAALEPLLALSRREGLEVEPLSLIGTDVAGDIAAVARIRFARLILMGFHKPLLGSAILGGTVHRVLNAAPTDVAVFVNRGLEKFGRVLVPYLGGPHGDAALELAARLARHTGASATVLHVTRTAPSQQQTNQIKGAVDKVFVTGDQQTTFELKVVQDRSPVSAIVREASGSDLLIVPLAEQWGLESHLFGFRPHRIVEESPTSLMIVRRGGAG